MFGSLRARLGRRSLMYGVAVTAVSTAALLVTMANSAARAADNGPPGRSFDFGEWSSYLGSGSSSQYSSLKQIDKANVGKLQVAWTYMAGDGPAPEFGPLVVNGKMYVLGTDVPDAAAAPAVGANGQARRGGGPQRSTVVCLDPTTGKELWRHKNAGQVGTRGMN